MNNKNIQVPVKAGEYSNFVNTKRKPELLKTLRDSPRRLLKKKGNKK